MTRLLDMQGHRGARALFPENTLQGFVAAASLGVEAFELDVGMTADGVVVVSHDPALNPEITRDASGAWLTERGPALWSLTRAQTCLYDVGRIRPGSPMSALFPDQTPADGARIPTLAAVLAALPQARFTIEVKTDPAHPDRTAPPHLLAEATLAVIAAAGAASRVVVEAFDWRVQRHIRATWPRDHTCLADPRGDRPPPRPLVGPCAARRLGRGQRRARGWTDLGARSPRSHASPGARGAQAGVACAGVDGEPAGRHPPVGCLGRRWPDLGPPRPGAEAPRPRQGG